MLSIGEIPENLELAWVKAQFLPRTALTYVETVDLVKTKFILESGEGVRNCLLRVG